MQFKTFRFSKIINNLGKYKVVGQHWEGMIFFKQEAEPRWVTVFPVKEESHPNYKL